jgi:riboflavin synthase
VVFKGSIAIDGISLTVAEVTRDTFSVWIIPHTYQVTALRERSAGQRVNLEADLLAKYVEKITPRT